MTVAAETCSVCRGVIGAAEVAHVVEGSRVICEGCRRRIFGRTLEYSMADLERKPHAPAPMVSAGLAFKFGFYAGFGMMAAAGIVWVLDRLLRLAAASISQ